MIEDDWDLLNRSGRDPAALDQLFRKHKDFVYRLAYGQLMHRESAEEVTQEVFYRLAKTRKRFFKAAVFRTWLFRVVQNMVKDQRRKLRKHQSQPLDQASETPVGASQEAWAELSNLSGLLDRLPKRQHEAVLLRMLEGFSVSETASAMGCSEGSVKTHLHRGLNTLKAMYEASQTVNER